MYVKKEKYWGEGGNGKEMMSRTGLDCQKAKSTSGVKAIECDVQGGRSPNPLTSSTFQSIETKALPKGSACVFW